MKQNQKQKKKRKHSRKHRYRSGFKSAVIIIIFLIAAAGIGMTAANPPGEDEKSETASCDWSESSAPNYVLRTGEAVVEDVPEAGQVHYSRLDKYGRTQAVTANVTYSMIKKSAGWREDIPKDASPSGWGHNRQVRIRLYNGKIYKGYLFNRSHLLADSLGGRAIRRNLITGTRTQNVGANDGTGGMAYTERKVLDYIYDHKNVTCYYRASPVYEGDEMVPRSVTVDVKTSDDALDMRVIVYNTAKGYDINYDDGTFTEDTPA